MLCFGGLLNLYVDYDSKMINVKSRFVVVFHATGYTDTIFNWKLHKDFWTQTDFPHGRRHRKSGQCPGHLRYHNDPLNCPDDTAVPWQVCRLSWSSGHVQRAGRPLSTSSLSGPGWCQWMWNKREAEASGFRKQVLVVTASRCILLHKQDLRFLQQVLWHPSL